MRYLFVLSRLILPFFTFGAASEAHAQQAAYDPSQCISPAAAFHHVHPDILASILTIESRMNPATVTKNSNGSIDVGMGGTNSVHFAELKLYGIAPANLLDACVSTYTTAWLLGKAVRKYGETWFGVAAFHSITPDKNFRYQVLVHNELVRRGALLGNPLPVPPLHTK